MITGAGRVGIGQSSQTAGFQISQRADFFEAEVGLETTLNRPIINTRDEPHADASRHRRLHVITGDANLSEISTYLKVGTASWVLRVIEAGELGQRSAARRAGRRDACGQPRPELRAAADLHSGGRAYGRRPAGDLPGARAGSITSGSPTSSPRRPGSRPRTSSPAGRTSSTRSATDLFRLADQLDWVAKLKLMESYRERDGLGWDAPKLALIDLQYADVDPRRSLYSALVAKGRMRRLVTDEEIERARTTPPEDTRAYFRGRVMEKFGRSVVAASWDSVIFDVPGRPALQRVPLLDPLRGTREQVGADDRQLRRRDRRCSPPSAADLAHAIPSPGCDSDLSVDRPGSTSATRRASAAWSVAMTRLVGHAAGGCPPTPTRQEVTAMAESEQSQRKARRSEDTRGRGARAHRLSATRPSWTPRSTRCWTRSTTCSRSMPRSSSARSSRRAASERSSTQWSGLPPTASRRGHVVLRRLRRARRAERAAVSARAGESGVGRAGARTAPRSSRRPSRAASWSPATGAPRWAT